MEIFDQDHDGYVDEDEQVAIFSVIKSKIQIVAEALCDIHNYGMYKSLMKEVREIEIQIVEYQDQLRKKIYINQLMEYKSIGEQIINDEKTKWSNMIKDYNIQLNKKKKQMLEKAQEDKETLELALERPREMTRLKSMPKLRELQYQEKLVAINERVEEAMNYRKELKVLEELNEKKKRTTKEKRDEKAKQNLLTVKKKEINELEAKINSNQRLLEKEREIQMVIVNKKVNLHVKDIERMQGLLSKYAQRRGKIEDELKRVRSNVRKTMKAIGDFKRASNSIGPTGRRSPTKTIENEKSTLIHSSNPLIFTNKKVSFTGHSSMEASSLNNPTFKNIIEPLQKLAKSTSYSRFDIKSTIMAKGEKPINQQDETLQGSLEKRIIVLLSQRKRAELAIPSVAELYDENLNNIGKSSTP